MRELSVLTSALKEITDITVTAFLNNDPVLARNTEPLEQVIDKLIDDMHKNHVDRLRKGQCTVEQGLSFNDLLTDLERISDHCSNISAAVIEIAHGSFQTHSYLNRFKNSSEEFEQIYSQYEHKYSI